MQEFLQTVLNKTKLILCLFGLFAFAALSQQTADISLEMSVEPSMTMYPGQAGLIRFKVSNQGTASANIYGRSLVAIQADGKENVSNLSFHDGAAGWIAGECYFDIDLEPTRFSNPLFSIVFSSISPGEAKVCELGFLIPQNTTEDFTVFKYNVASSLLDPNPNNNTASVRINIQPRTTSVPTLRLWGLLILVLGLLLLVKYRRKILF